MPPFPSFVETNAEKSAYAVAVAGGWAEWVRHKADLRAIASGCTFSLKHALYVRQWMQRYIRTAPGHPFLLLDWQWRDVIAPIRQRVKEISELFNLREIALDRNWQGQAMMTNLAADGHNIVPFAQNLPTMSPPSKLFEVLVRKGLIRHGDNPILQWCAANCVAFTDINQNLKPDKKKSTEKIDPVVASIMAMGRATVADGLHLRLRHPQQFADLGRVEHLPPIFLPHLLAVLAKVLGTGLLERVAPPGQGGDGVIAVGPGEHRADDPAAGSRRGPYSGTDSLRRDDAGVD